MDHWILDNLEKLVPIVIALLYFLGSNKVRKMEEGKEAADPEAAERSRRIQEEIRRKVLERQGQGNPASRREAPAPSLWEEAPSSPLPWEMDSDGEESDDSAEPTLTLAQPKPLIAEDLYEKQWLRIEDQLAKAKEMKKLAAAKSRSIRSAPASLSQGDIRKRLRKDLDDSGSIRRAFLLKEILDKPVGLR